jgi:sulfide dehydrogenase cytochrome subunit
MIDVSIAAGDPMLKMCVSCHGEDGRGTDSDTPIIAGLPAVVQEDALYSYLDGDRDCGAKPMMCKVVGRLSEEQIVALSEHYAALPYVPANEEFDAALAATGKVIHQRDCAICHGSDDPGDAEASILHGQRKGFLQYAMQQYAAGQRKQLPAMERKLTTLTGEDIEALVNYYASYRN